MDIKLLTTEKGKQLLIVDGYTYYEKRKLKSDEIVWQCSRNKKCTAKIYTQLNKTSISRFDALHNHENNEETTQRKILYNSVKRKAEDILERPSKIIHSAIAENPTCLEQFTTRNAANLRKAIYRKRRQEMPTLPKNREEAIEKLFEKELKTVKGEDFLLLADVSSGLVVFSCHSNLSFLSKCQKIYMDGTFKYCTKFWMQLFTIHGIKNSKYVPLAFCLLPDKKEETYARLFSKIRKKCLERNLYFEPEHFVVDFEIAIQNAVRVVWPSASVQGCKFHLGQAWHRKILNLGLGKEFRERESNEIGQWLKKLFGLSYLKPEDVGECLAFDLISCQPDDSRLQKFVDYLVENYIEENSKFPPSMWAKADASAENTTNACESFHAHFNKCFYQVHPNINYFLEILLQCQTDCYIRMSSTDEHKIVSKAVLHRRQNLDELVQKYLNGNVSRIDLVKFASNKFRPLA